MLGSFQVCSKVDFFFMYIYPHVFSFFSHIGHYGVLSRVPCAIQQAPRGGGGGLLTKSCLTLAAPRAAARQAPPSIGFPCRNIGGGGHFLLQEQQALISYLFYAQ